MTRYPLISSFLLAVMASPILAQTTSAGHPSEGDLGSFLGEPKIEISQVFKGNRFPNVVVAIDGTVLSFLTGVKVRRSEDAGRTWGPEITVGKGFMGGGVIVNEANGEILAFGRCRRGR